MTSAFQTIRIFIIYCWRIQVPQVLELKPVPWLKSLHGELHGENSFHKLLTWFLTCNADFVVGKSQIWGNHLDLVLKSSSKESPIFNPLLLSSCPCFLLRLKKHILGTGNPSCLKGYTRVERRKHHLIFMQDSSNMNWDWVSRVQEHVPVQTEAKKKEAWDQMWTGNCRTHKQAPC